MNDFDDNYVQAKRKAKRDEISWGGWLAWWLDLPQAVLCKLLKLPAVIMRLVDAYYEEKYGEGNTGIDVQLLMTVVAVSFLWLFSLLPSSILVIVIDKMIYNINGWFDYAAAVAVVLAILGLSGLEYLAQFEEKKNE